MANADDLEAMAKACVAAQRLVATHGTPIMQELMRLLLFELGTQLASDADFDETQQDQTD